MIIYEVTLQIDETIREAYMAWLGAHIEEMGHFDGFEGGELEEAEEAEPGRFCLVVRYPVRDREALETYFHSGAAAMRKDGLRRFPDQFSATRRILTPISLS